MPVSSRLKEGDRAPDFELVSQDGQGISLEGVRRGKDVVLYFYPKDFTMGCTTETREFSAAYDRLVGMGAEVIGISSDTEETHARFASECGARFPLLSDSGGKVRELYGVRPSMGLVPGRVTFVIDREGVVRRIFSSQLNPRRHVEEAVKALNEISGRA